MNKIIYALFLILLSICSYAGSVPIPFDGTLATATGLQIDNTLDHDISYYYNNIDTDQTGYETYTDQTSIMPGTVTNIIDSWEGTNTHHPITFLFKGVGVDAKNYLLLATSEKQIGSLDFNIPSEIGMYFKIVKDNLFPKAISGNTPDDAEYSEIRWNTDKTPLTDLSFREFQGIVRFFSDDKKHLVVQVCDPEGKQIANYVIDHFQVSN